VCQKAIIYVQDAVTRHKLGAQYSGEGMWAINRIINRKLSRWKQFGHYLSSNYECDQTHTISVNTFCFIWAALNSIYSITP
jgi:hypothetical protein